MKPVAALAKPLQESFLDFRHAPAATDDLNARLYVYNISAMCTAGCGMKAVQTLMKK
jgi:hypothetical protein